MIKAFTWIIGLVNMYTILTKAQMVWYKILHKAYIFVQLSEINYIYELTRSTQFTDDCLIIIDFPKKKDIKGFI